MIQSTKFTYSKIEGSQISTPAQSEDFMRGAQVPPTFKEENFCLAIPVLCHQPADNQAKKKRKIVQNYLLVPYYLLFGRVKSVIVPNKTVVHN